MDKLCHLVPTVQLSRALTARDRHSTGAVSRSLDNFARRPPLTRHMKLLWLVIAIYTAGCQPRSQVGSQDAPHPNAQADAMSDASNVGQAGKVACGASSCDNAQGDTCCLKVSTGTPSCGAQTCPQFSSKIACDGPEDCGGTACCGNIGSGFSCTTDMVCSSGIAQLCHTDADCPAALPTCCPYSYGTWETRGCSSAPPGAC